jgi:homoserine kinase type II
MSLSAPRASVPVTTDVTAATDAELQEVLDAYVLGAFSFERCTGGVNNAVYRAHRSSKGKDEYIVRIYRNGKNTERVIYEHAVLEALRDKSLSFAVPRMIKNPDNRTFTFLKTGEAACVCEVIPGGPAPLEAAFVIGKATAELVGVMATVHIPK